METYNAADGTSEKKVLSMPAVYLGLTRSGVTEKLEDYMENLSITDLEKGLVGFDLMYFFSGLSFTSQNLSACTGFYEILRKVE